MKPTNQASRRSLVVPVLPAASSANPAPRTLAAVPSLITLRIMFTTRYMVSARDTRFGFSTGTGARSFVPLVIRRIVRNGRVSPRFGNAV